MTSLSLQIDMDRIQSSVTASVRPAVDAALKDIDVAAIIKARLKSSMQPESRYLGISRYLMGDERPSGSLVESLVESGIREMAKAYVERELAAQKATLEEAFCQMMRGSQNKIVAAFAEVMTESIKGMDFRFSAAVAHKESVDD